MGRRRHLIATLVAALGVVGVANFVPEPQEAAAGPAGLSVVLVLTDDQSLEALQHMPATNGRSDWIRFENAFIEHPLCCPSRATILSGLYSHHTGVEDNFMGGNFAGGRTVARWLDDAGYRTGYVGKYLNGYPFDRPLFVPRGWDDWKTFVETGYDDYTLYETRGQRPSTLKRFGGRAKHYSTDLLAKRATTLISGYGDDPFFLVLAPFAPHTPRVPAPRDAGTFTDLPITHSPNFNEEDVSDKPFWVQNRDPVNVASMERKRREQYETLQAVDDAVTRVFTTLEAQARLDDTVVVFMTDNGFTFGEHRARAKGCPYEECISTPLLVRVPGQPGRSEDALVSNVDLAPTIAALAGVTPPPDRDGVSLVPILEGGDPPWRDSVLLHDVKYGGWWGVRTANHKYVEYEKRRPRALQPPNRPLRAHQRRRDTRIRGNPSRARRPARRAQAVDPRASSRLVIRSRQMLARSLGLHVARPCS
jgi:N-acetylglucosamine-6-sulfatase